MWLDKIQHCWQKSYVESLLVEYGIIKNEYACLSTLWWVFENLRCIAAVNNAP